ncbi:multifunctional acyl-CoA thioesterase I/protease I/lysophospholipase L1 [Sodalis sp. dw_96]|uniref:multifunctional acyl-CoA thioesterase I/protease I/lysophospholipase L1 n=1 Tax=Sodalis sp. dw_96 TaxID=2719794 RepID=UPI001BD6A37E|nr:multifunctional acyl-CoA thioesterase I/protease I/lysophospholipase L1 [Sodalis sp. dw_96]
MMNFKSVFRWHFPFLLLLGFFSVRAIAADTLLILGDSLSAGYRMAANQAWPSLLNDKWRQQSHGIQVINGSISGDTATQGLARLPALLKLYKPRWVVIELGGNDGLRGFPPPAIQQDLSSAIQQVKQSGAQPLLMQIRLPPNYGQRYTQSFSAIYPALAQKYGVPLLPFFMEQVYLKPQWMQDDAIHPNPLAQPFIAEWMSSQLTPLLKPDVAAAGPSHG